MTSVSPTPLHEPWTAQDFAWPDVGAMAPPEPVLPVPAPSRGFSAWLRRQDGRRGPVGALAFDVRHDQTWPGDVPVLEMFDHLRSEGAIPAALAALHDAWSEFTERGTA